MNERPEPTSQQGNGEPSSGGKFLTFNLAREEYGITILKVKEIIGLLPITEVPRLPDEIKGVVNLRGKVIPVMDLRLRFAMPSEDYTDRTCIIVLEVGDQAGTVLMGVIVDSVSEVLNIGASDIDAPPSFGTGMDTSFILGMAKTGKDVKILLDVDRVLTRDEVGVLSKIQ